ncbi:MAG TPA: polysaccharide deacetylase family protein [Candidatus Saccharimonadales bacterium]|nr:polysaccharide deacetylase family protein [Candidatus Saccharimonadales bacterium]
MIRKIALICAIFSLQFLLTKTSYAVNNQKNNLTPIQTDSNSSPTINQTQSSRKQLSSDFTRPIITLTFDDGIKTQLTNGWPIMKKYDLKGTFYIISGALDGDWYMLPENVLMLSQNGNEIAAHTVTHPDLTTLSTSQVQYELAQSQQSLQTLLSRPVTDFATPYGAYNDSVIALIKQYYRSHRTAEVGYNTKINWNQYRLYSMSVMNTTTTTDISGWIAHAKKDKSWLILDYHSIEANPTTWGTTPEQFDMQLNLIKKSGVVVKTIDQALSELTPQFSP